MRVLAAALLALLLCARPGRGQVQDGDEDEDPGREGYEDGYEDDDEDGDQDEAGAGWPAGGGGRGLRCYECQALRSPEPCGRRHNCSSRHAFCKTLLAHGHGESGPLTTYSGWCSDTCHPITRTVAGTLMTVACCRLPLCNVPPWQGRPGGGAGGPRGSPLALAAGLLLGLLAGRGLQGS